MSQTQPTTMTRRSFRLRYSLRTLFVLVTVLSVGLGYMAYESKRQKRILAELEKLAFFVRYFEDRTKPDWLPEVLDISVLDRVQELNFRGLINDVSILGELTNLEVLDLEGTPVSDVSPLRKLKNLKRLDLGETRVGDVSPLTDVTNLRTLFLPYTQVTDVSALRELKNLEWLDLRETQVSDVSALEGLKNLEMLDLEGTQVSADDIEKLQASLPLCEIDY